MGPVPLIVGGGPGMFGHGVRSCKLGINILKNIEINGSKSYVLNMEGLSKQYLEVVFPIDIRFGKVIFNFQRSISDLVWEPVLQVQHAGLTYILQLGAGLAHLTLLEPHLVPRTPPEDCEGPGADLALLPVLLLGHPDVRVVSQAGLTKGWGSQHPPSSVDCKCLLTLMQPFSCTSSCWTQGEVVTIGKGS